MADNRKYIEQEIVGGINKDEQGYTLDPWKYEAVAMLREQWNAGKLYSEKGKKAAFDYAEKYEIPSDDASLKTYKHAFSNPNYRIVFDDDTGVWAWKNNSNNNYKTEFYSSNDFARFLTGGNKNAYDELIASADDYHTRVGLSSSIENFDNISDDEFDALVKKESSEFPLYDKAFKNEGSELGLLGDIVARRSSEVRGNDEYLNKDAALANAAGGDILENVTGGGLFKLGGRVANKLASTYPRLGNIVKGVSGGATSGAGTHLSGLAYDNTVGGDRPYGNQEFSTKNLLINTGVGSAIAGGAGLLGLKTPMTRNSKAEQLLRNEYGRYNKNWYNPANKAQTAEDLKRLREYAMRSYDNRADDFVYEDFNRRFGDMPVMSIGEEVMATAPNGERIPLRRYSNRKDIPSANSDTFVKNEDLVEIPEDGRFERVADERLGNRPERIETEGEITAREFLDKVRNSGNVKYKEKAAKEADRRLKADLKNSKDYEDFISRVNASTGNLSLAKPETVRESSERLKALYSMYENAIAAGKPTDRIEVAIGSEVDKINRLSEKKTSALMKNFEDQAVVENRASSKTPKSETEKLYEELAVMPDDSKLEKAQKNYDNAAKRAEKEYQKEVNEYDFNRRKIIDEEKAKYRKENAPYEYVSPDNNTASEFLNERGLSGNSDAAIDLLRESQFKPKGETTIGDVISGDYKGTVRETNELINRYSSSRPSDMNPDIKRRAVKLADQYLRDKVVPYDISTGKVLESLRLPYRNARSETGRLRSMIGGFADSEHILGNPPKGTSFKKKVSLERKAGTRPVISNLIGFGAIPTAGRASERFGEDYDE